jgi:2-iminobutanoate/2-iminopropanoate deaminase
MKGQREEIRSDDCPGGLSTGVAHKIGRYSDAVRVPAGYEQIVTSGTPGLRPDGTLPDDFAEEARQAWRNVAEALAAAGAQLTDIVSVRQWLTTIGVQGDDRH